MTMAYTCDLGSGQRVFLENVGEQTTLTVATSSAGQQQQSGSQFTTGVWTAPPELFRTVQGMVIRLTTAQGNHHIQLQGNQLGIMAQTPNLGNAQQMQMGIATSMPNSPPPMPPMPPMPSMDPMPPMPPMQPIDPMPPLSPMTMGNMEMNANPMQMRMGNMEMQMGNAAAETPPPAAPSSPLPAANAAPKAANFCGQCGAAEQPSDRFCAKCGHQLQS